jgi:hypothetical protein
VPILRVVWRMHFARSVSVRVVFLGGHDSEASGATLTKATDGHPKGNLLSASIHEISLTCPHASRFVCTLAAGPV